MALPLGKNAPQSKPMSARTRDRSFYLRRFAKRVSPFTYRHRRDSPRAGGRGRARSKPGSGDGAEEGGSRIFPERYYPVKRMQGGEQIGGFPGCLLQGLPDSIRKAIRR